MQPITVTKNLIAASTTGIATFSSAGALSAINSSDLGTARRIVVWGSTSVATTFRITGTSETGTPIGETITGSSIGAEVATTQDFRTVTGIAIGSTAITSTAGYIGTNTKGGTPWKVVDTWREPVALGFNVTTTTTGIIASLEYTQDYPAYNVQAGTWAGNATLTGPVPTISTACSSVTAATNGTFAPVPVAAWRVTLTSTSSGAGTVNATVIQSG